MATADFLDQKRTEIAARIQELRPLVDEYRRLEAAATAIDSLATTAAPARSTVAARQTRAHTTQTAARAHGAPPRRRGRPKGSGKRADEALALIRATPGITIADLATRMGIKNNYLYRVLPALAQDGLIVKDARGWKARDPE